MSTAEANRRALVDRVKDCLTAVNACTNVQSEVDRRLEALEKQTAADAKLFRERAVGLAKWCGQNERDAKNAHARVTDTRSHLRTFACKMNFLERLSWLLFGALPEGIYGEGGFMENVPPVVGPSKLPAYVDGEPPAADQAVKNPADGVPYSHAPGVS